MYSVYRSEDYNEHSPGIVGPLRALRLSDDAHTSHEAFPPDSPPPDSPWLVGPVHNGGCTTHQAFPKNVSLIVHPDYNPDSPWLVGPVHTRGYCVGNEDLNYERFVWIDFAAPIVSGRAISVVLETKHAGIRIAGKILEFTRDGTPWLLCYGNNALDRLVAIPLHHPMLRVLAIGADVMEARIPCERRDRLPDDGIWRHLAHIGERALREWRKHGFTRQVIMPVENHESNIDLVRAAIDEGRARAAAT